MTGTVRPATGAHHTASLPPDSTGDRSRRRRSRHRRRLARSLAFVAVAALVAGGVVAAVVWSLSTMNRGRSHGRVAGSAASAAAAATTLLVERDRAGGGTSITLLAVDGDSRGGHVVFVPPATMTEIPSVGLDTLTKALDAGGPALLQPAAENLLGLPLERVVVVDDAQLTAMVQPAGPLRVHVAQGFDEWPAGDDALNPADLARFLNGRADTDLARLARQQAFWEAWLGRVRAVPSVLPAATANGLGGVVARLAAGDVDYDTLPVDSLGTGDDETYRPRAREIEALMRQLSSDAARDRVRVQVLNGTGAVGVTPRVMSKVIAGGGRVVLTGNADHFDYADTRVVYSDQANQPKAAKIQAALGVGKVVLTREPLNVADVTIVVGRDFK